MEQVQEIHKIALDETEAAQVIKLLLLKPQAAKCRNFSADFINVGSQINIVITTFEAILDLRTRKMMQHNLHHREFVQISIEQRRNNHGTEIGRLTNERCS